MTKFIIFLINIYQKLKKPFPKVCRFYPTCSEYTKQAILKHGILKGIFFGVKRIVKCHPFHSGGFDPVP